MEREEAELGLGALRDMGGLQGISCDVPLAPGDVLFFREDVNHRTQDVEQDRIALIIDVHRLPLGVDAPYRVDLRL